MKTPFDSALRVQQRAIDAIRIRIGLANDAQAALAGERADVDAALARESGVSADDWALASHAYLRRMRGTRTRLERDQIRLDGTLDALRDDVANAYAPLRAMEGAVERFGDASRHAEAATEQARADDFSGARFAATRRSRVGVSG
jgi:flagellar export protein FliJ